MHFTTKSRYAIRALVDIARHQAESGGNPVRRHDTGTRQGFSPDYLEQILSKLKQGGVVETVRGPGGGYRLTKDPSQINLWEVFSLVESRFRIVPCADSDHHCKRWECCDMKHLWRHLQALFRAQLTSITLAQVLGGEFKAN